MDSFMPLWLLNRSNTCNRDRELTADGGHRRLSSAEAKVQSVKSETLVNLSSSKRPPPPPPLPSWSSDEPASLSKIPLGSDSSAATSVIISSSKASVAEPALRSQQNWEPKGAQNLIQNGESRPAFRAVVTSSCRPDSPNTTGGMNPQINPQYFVDEAESLANPADFACGKRSTLVIAGNRKRAAVEVPVVSWSASSIRDLSAASTRAAANGSITGTCSASESSKYQTSGAVPTSAAGTAAQQAGHTGVSPVPSLSCSDIGEMDLDFWDVEAKLDSNGIAHPLPPQQQQNATTVLVNHTSSPNSSQLQQQSQQQLRQAQQAQQQLYSQGKDGLSPATPQTSFHQSGYFPPLSGELSPRNMVIQSMPPSHHHHQLQANPPDANNNNSNTGSTGSNASGGNCQEFAKPKKGPLPRQQEELCLVCGDRASGYHYNALTCEGCKGFFRRSITKNSVYTCKYGDNCDIDMYMRRKCQQCRLRKCLRVGMRPECVVPESQNVMKRHSKKRSDDAKDSLPRPIETNSNTGGTTVINISHCRDEKPNLMALNRAIRMVQPLTPDQESLINNLCYYQLEFESPSLDDFSKITAFTLGDTDEDNQKRFQHITEVTILTVQLIVEFSKRVPGFDTLKREDQITLLKACSSEVMMLRGARKYDMKTDSIVFANNQPYTRENYRSASVGDSADALFRFCRKMFQLRVDNAEYALLTAIVIFSERPGLMDPEKVDQIQMFYTNTLRMYCETRSQSRDTPAHFAKLLAVLTELRTLGNLNSEMCFSLTVKENKKLPPFLAEIWDIQG